MDKLSSNETVLVSDQYAPAAMVNPEPYAGMLVPSIETPLHHADLAGISARVIDMAGVNLSEQPLTGLLTLRANVHDETAHACLDTACQTTLQLSLPTRLQSSSGPGTDACIRWMAPDEWLVSCAVANIMIIELALRDAMTDHSFAAVNVSAGYTLLNLSGAHAMHVLKKSTGYDSHPRNLPPGKVVNTTFAKTQATLRCTANDSYELIVRRSYADYIWLWLQSASREYGLQVTNG